MFALVDCNNFYASCERVFNPKWKGKPIVVLSNNDGCVIARSNEAKALGIPMGAPYFQYKTLIEAHGVIVCSSNYTLYGDFSARVMNILKRFSSQLQIYSIDEAFMMVEGTNLKSFCGEIRETVLKWTGIPVSIGIGATKTLAKAANQHAKKRAETGGIFVLDSQQEIDRLLDLLPVDSIWGVGKRLAARLNRRGVITAKDLRDADDAMIRKNLSVVGLKTAWELRGISCLPLEQIPSPKKSVTSSRAFGAPVDCFDKLCEAAASYTARAAEKIREQHSLATAMTLFVELHPFSKDRPNYFHVRATLPEPTDYTPLLIHYAKEAVVQIFQKGTTYRKAGVILDDLVPDDSYQRDLFTPVSTHAEKQKKIMKTMDAINEYYGRNALHSAAEGLKKPWKMKQQLRSGKYTTSWAELLTVKI